MDEKKGKTGKKNEKTDDFMDFNINIDDIDIPEINTNIFDVVGVMEDTESRYTKPKARQMNASQVMYENAIEMAKDTLVDRGQRVDALVSGAFIFGDFLEAYMTIHNIRAKQITISTLSLSQNNVDSLKNLYDGGYYKNLDMVVSAYFYAYELRALIPYMYDVLDQEDSFQLAVAGIHTKTINILTEGGRKIVIHGSANLRSSGNIEQVTIEENPELFDFYEDNMQKIIAEYKTINKPIRNKKLWNTIIKKTFKD